MARIPLDGVAARTRAAQQILGDQGLLTRYEAVGGLSDDLEAIRDAGLRAEAQSLLQSTSKGQGKAATLDVLQAFAALQREYMGLMAAVQAARGDLARTGASNDLLAALDQILVNEAQVVVVSAPQPEGENGKKRRARSVSQEALRAEISRDAKALLELGAAHEALTRRKVDTARLSRLQEDAEALAGQLAERAVKKGAGKAATNGKSDAVKEQSDRWAECYRLLALVGQRDERVAQLLKEAAQALKKK
ncbi:MAG TPA: hypothetical protein VLS89_01975 [Candidatus Nanopelagicales bacterium]|nr:hypothetical protein [Candidatus Nanopelagicales bacterium]